MKHLLCLTLALLFVACSLTCTGRSSSGIPQSRADGVTEEDLKECGSKMHITFPQSTRAVNIDKITGGPDDGIFLKIEIDRKEMDALIKSSPFASVELRSERRYVLKEPTLSWWNPESARNYKSGQAQLPDAKYLNILLDLDGNERVTVYLQWGET
jgi:hypothetical protein